MDRPSRAKRVRALLDKVDRPNGSDDPSRGQRQPLQNAPVAGHQFAAKVRSLRRAKAHTWSKEVVSELQRLGTQACREAVDRAAAAQPHNTFATEQAANQTRQQLRQLLDALEPPQHVAESPEFVALAHSLMAEEHKVSRPTRSSFARGTGLRGRPRADILAKQVSSAVEEADWLATEKRVALGRHVAGKSEPNLAAMTFGQLARRLRRKRRKKGKLQQSTGFQEEDSPIEGPSEEGITAEELETLASMALETMEALRAEVAPKWAPERQPWLLHEADNEVYATLLAVAPLELFRQTQAFEEMERLRTAQAAVGGDPGQA